MTQEEREEFYDREIAPTLLELARKCQDNGLSFVAEVEWWPGEGGTTAAIAADASVTPRMVHMAARARGNVDALVIGLQRYGREHGHNSVVLGILERGKDT